MLSVVGVHQIPLCNTMPRDRELSFWGILDLLTDRKHTAFAFWLSCGLWDFCQAAIQQELVSTGAAKIQELILIP